MTDRLAPVRTDLAGAPRTGRLVLPSPRPEYVVTIERSADGATLTARSTFGGAPCVVPLVLVPRHLTDELVPVAEHWRGVGFIDGYEWRIHADADMRVLSVFDDLPTQRRPRTIADVGAATAGA